MTWMTPGLKELRVVALLAVLVLNWMIIPVDAETAKPGAAPDDWIYLDNGVIRLGVIRSAGAGIGYLSRSDSDKNLLNHYDRGRLIQQSYYGDEDGSKWVDRPWRLNPVQGGDYRNRSPRLIEIRAGETELYSRSTPRHWATGGHLEDFVLEQWIRLRGDLVHVTFRMTYDGEQTHAPRHQELPAVFLDPSLSRLILYDGDALTEQSPGQTNEYFDIPEHWAAFVDESGEGVGVCTPSADQITCYRFRGGADSDCSYLAPIATFSIRPGLTWEYDTYFLIGKPEAMRARFQELAADGG